MVRETFSGAERRNERRFIMFSDPGFQIRIGKKEGVYRLTISKTLTNVLPRIVAKAHNWIQFPNNENTIHEALATSLEQSTVQLYTCSDIKAITPW
jgi:hypothetical protein